jgi:DNA polymerase-3 subunit alpha
MASLIIEDGVKKINAVLFSQALGSNSDQLILDEVVVISGKVNKDFRDQWQVVIDNIEPVEKVQVKYAKYLQLSLSKNNKLEYVEICQLLKEFHGKCPVMIEYHSNNASGNIPLKSEYDVSLQRDLLDALDKNLGQGKYKIQY